MQIEMSVLADVLNTHFGLPFLEEGHVRAEATDRGTLKIYIGRRDIDVDAGGNIVGAGTCIDGPPIREDEEVPRPR